MHSADHDPGPHPDGNGTVVGQGATGGVAWAMRSEPGDVRPHNEDFVGAFIPDVAAGGAGADRGPLFVVCDGLGGHAAGEVASRTAVESALNSWAASGPSAAHQAARSAVRAANLSVYDASLERGRRGMATTLTALTLAGREAVVAHVGDTRAYLVRDGVCSQLTADHSRVGDMLRMGLISPEQAAVHPARSQLTRTVGGDLTVQVDMVRTPCLPGDVFVLCSDGLWDTIPRAEMAGMVDAVNPADAVGPGDGAAEAAAADRLVATALARRSPDNVTALVVRVKTDQPGPAATARRSLFRRGFR
jgi:serine/threonine protein phosphatase PrpC